MDVVSGPAKLHQLHQLQRRMPFRTPSRTEDFCPTLSVQTRPGGDELRLLASRVAPRRETGIESQLKYCDTCTSWFYVGIRLFSNASLSC